MIDNTNSPQADSYGNQDLPVSYADVLVAARRLKGVANKTPVMTSRTVDALTSGTVFFKCENFQRGGSFKFRGAYHALSRLTEEQRLQGVLTFSSGNHAQAIALAGSLLVIPTTIVMPQDAPEVKIAATRGYGGKIVFYDRARTRREVLAQELADKEGLTLIPPYDHPHIIAGQGTAAKEFFEEVGELDILLVCCGGGGLLSGSSLSAQALSPDCRVIGVEPAAADDATRSFKTGILQSVHNPETIADGARTSCLGHLTFPIILRYVQDMVTVSEEAIVHAMSFLWERMKLVVEPTGALAAAALLDGTVKAHQQRIGVIISGGNVDIRRQAVWHQD